MIKLLSINSFRVGWYSIVPGEDSRLLLMMWLIWNCTITVGGDEYALIDLNLRRPVAPATDLPDHVGVGKWAELTVAIRVLQVSLIVLLIVPSRIPLETLILNILSHMNPVKPLRVGLHFLRIPNIAILFGLHSRKLIHSPHQHSWQEPEQKLYRVTDLHVVDYVLVLYHRLNRLGMVHLRLDEVYCQQVKQNAVHYYVKL